MNDEPFTPSVPRLSDEWIARRTQHLVDEVSAPSPRHRRRLVMTSAAASAAAAAAVLVGLLGPWATPAFAGWSAQPTSPTSGQLSTAEATCASLATQLTNLPGGSGSTSLAPASLSDVRGPYSLILYGTVSPALCVSGNGLTSLKTSGEMISIGGGTGSTARHQSVTHSSGVTKWERSNGSAPAPGAAVMDLTYTSSENEQSLTVAQGSVGSQVSGATLLLSDGSSVVATVSNGLFAAWWPGQSTVSSIEVTARVGVQ